MKARWIVAFLSIIYFSSSYATLEQCYKDGVAKEYEKVLDSCAPYLKTDARATGLLAEAYVQLDQDDKLALEDALWAVNFYDKNGAPTDVEGRKSYAYLVYLIGELYFFGSDDLKDDIPVDQEKGFEYIRKAAILGYARAQNQLGNFYVRAGKVPGPNFARAFKWYKLAIANGNLEAREAFLINNEQRFVDKYPYCISQGRALIGDAYFKGQGGLPKDINRAIKWYDNAYKIDHISPVEVGLAKIYLAKGDKKTALKYTKEAIEQPYAPAFVLMADLTDDKVSKYAYLSEAIALFKAPELDFWNQFNAYCQPNLSGDGIKDAEAKFNEIKLTKEEVEEAKGRVVEIHWQTISASPTK